MVTGLTTLIKFLLATLSFPPFGAGLLSSLNFSISFVGLQFLGFTLATKQPAMTATVLAAQIEESWVDSTSGVHNATSNNNNTPSFKKLKAHLFSPTALMQSPFFSILSFSRSQKVPF